MNVIKKYKLLVIRKISTRDAMYNILNIISTVVHYQVVGRLNLKNTSQGKKKEKITKIVYLSIGDDRCSLTMFENIDHYGSFGVQNQTRSEAGWPCI